MSKTESQIIIGKTGPDWKPRPKEAFYAQFEGNIEDGGGLFEFGSTPQEAMKNLITKHGDIAKWWTQQ